MEGCRQELVRKCFSPPKGRGAESLQVLCNYLVNMIQELRDAGPPAPLIYQGEEDDNDEMQYEDVEHIYYNIQEARAYALEGDEWWAPGLSYPCGIPGDVHSLAVCTEFGSLDPKDRHSKLHPGSVCKMCLGPQTWCCPLGFTCTNNVPDGLQCGDCLEKVDEWGYPTFNALFCT